MARAAVREGVCSFCEDDSEVVVSGQAAVCSDCARKAVIAFCAHRRASSEPADPELLDSLKEAGEILVGATMAEHSHQLNQALGHDTVHILHHGLPLCRFTVDLPEDWPAGHSWTDLSRARESNCRGCQTRHEGQ